MAYVFNGLDFGFKNEGNPEICDNMDEPLRHCTKWNVTEGQILHDSTYINYQK